MRLVQFGADGRIGALEDSRVVDLQAAFAARLEDGGEPAATSVAAAAVPPDLAAFIARGREGLLDAEAALEFARLHPEAPYNHEASTTPLRAPYPGRRIACVGSNYAEHSVGMAMARPGATPTTVEEVTANARASGQWGFFKVPYPVLGPESEIAYPSRTAYLDYEGELAVVIGRQGKNIPAAEAADYVYGVTLFNDLSIRDDRAATRPMSYNLAKNFDGSAVLGPAILVPPGDLQGIDVETRVNGELRQSYNTKSMIFSFAEVIEFLSRDFTLVPGDVISGGTSAGTASDSTPRGEDGSISPGRFLKPGDVVEVSSPAIGTLRSAIVAR